jgi:hypothetical protein
MAQVVDWAKPDPTKEQVRQLWESHTQCHLNVGPVIARFVGKVQGLESGLETGVTEASPPTVTSMGSSFYLGGQIQGRRP